MSIPYFIWKGVDCRKLGIMVETYPPMVKPKERVEQVAIPGLSGKLVIPEGDYPVYDNYLKNVKCWCRPSADMQAVCAFLTGEGLLVLGNEPNRAYRARIINQIDFAQIVKGREYRNFTIPFDVSPLKRIWPATAETVFSFTPDAMGDVINSGNQPCYPTITMTADDEGTIILQIGANLISFNAPTAGTYILDYEAQLFYNSATMENVSPLLTSPRVILETADVVLNGAHPVSWTGPASAVSVLPNWRWV